jgi:hypothetical protein
MATPAATAIPATYVDPFAYCAAVGTVDTPGSNYVGPQVPESVAQGLQQALNAPDTPIDVLENGSFWRCMDGNVYACFVGANLPCEAKANTDRTPTQEELDYCQKNPNSDFIPAVVTGRETVYEWRCLDGAPNLSGTMMLGGVCDNPRVEAQLEETALQFPTVSQVSVFVNSRPLEEVLSLKGEGHND